MKDLATIENLKLRLQIDLNISLSNVKKKKLHNNIDNALTNKVITYFNNCFHDQ